MIHAKSEVENFNYSEYIKNIEEEIKFIFEIASSYENGELLINKYLLIQKYGVEKANNIEKGIKKIYKIDSDIYTERYVVKSAFIDCMKGELVGMIHGMDFYQLLESGDVVAYIQGRAWGKVAELIGKQMLRFDIKANIGTLIASLAYSGVKCKFWG
ncbi:MULTISPECIES: hypothetical protein [Helcococcus]|uniref:Uncharacterized protein n=1 Tax=Helcococcus bovis TaxID=3153252 RepID=A0ABW9F8B7_9FIRM